MSKDTEFEIYLSTREDAEKALDRLQEKVADIGHATVADAYDLMGISTSSRDFQHGWDNLSKAEIIKTRDGYVIEFPPRIAV